MPEKNCLLLEWSDDEWRQVGAPGLVTREAARRIAWCCVQDPPEDQTQIGFRLIGPADDWQLPDTYRIVQVRLPAPPGADPPQVLDRTDRYQPGCQHRVGLPSGMLVMLHTDRKLIDGTTAVAVYPQVVRLVTIACPYHYATWRVVEVRPYQTAEQLDQTLADLVAAPRAACWR